MVRDPETERDVAAGMGQVHIGRWRSEKLKRKFEWTPSLAASPRLPRDRHGKAKAQGKYKRQSGARAATGLPQSSWSRCRADRVQFEDGIVGGVIPRNFIPLGGARHPRRGEGRARSGGFRLVDFKVTLVDGSFHTWTLGHGVSQSRARWR